METLALGGLLLLGYLNKNNRTKEETIDKDIVKENELPSQHDLYASRRLDTVLGKVFKKSTDNWDASKDVANTGILPVAYKDRTQTKTTIEEPNQKIVQDENDIKYLEFNTTTRRRFF
jgi:hypothetical protein